ncbi:MAG: isoleucine--tRNA ligase [Archaeoglobi archaeon]|nr:isoleucine--tRNA ligase [Candidatus Mnemosynella bozhongmuii]
MFRDVKPQYNPQEIEKEIQEFWKREKIYEKTRELRKNEKDFFFVDGPPYTTGEIHLGTAWNKIIKDSVLRYLTMRKFRVEDRPGWDMHGLPIEVKVENYLNFKSKKEIEEYGVEKFIETCKKFAIEQKDRMTEQFKKLGVWMKWDDPYMTITDDYIEAVWWTLKQAHEKGLLERGLRVVNWCPRCETAIADSEVEYWDEEDPSIYVKFPVKGEEKTYLVIWTTTPWTIPANLAVAVHPSLEYAKVRARKGDEEEFLILASTLVDEVLKLGGYDEWEIVESYLGEDLENLEYEHPLKEEVPVQKTYEHRVYVADFVTAERTGCVHCAPAYGQEDFELGRRKNLEVLNLLDERGVYTERAGKYAGMHIKEANPLIIEDLRNKGLLLHESKIVHRYGHCWRCKTPIIFMATVQWFIKITELKERMLEEIKKVRWYPSWAGESRFRDWIENAHDWCISRQRYWGVPLPIWECERCRRIKVIGSKKELIEASIEKPENLELHRPYVDAIHLPCECGGVMRRVEDVFDVWFDSAVASWATVGFPQRKDKFEKLWPADFITEGHDQTRGWFYSQLGASMVAFGRAPYKSVLMHGFTLDDEGRKMSKSLGNYVSPEEIISKYGADVLRAYVLSSSAPWDDLRFSWEELRNVYRIFNIFWNVYRFPLPYMILDGFSPEDWDMERVREHLRVEDRWILSRVDSCARDVEKFMSGYEFHKALRSIFNLITEDISRWYIQLVRPRAWIEKDDPDKLAAYNVLYYVLRKLVLMLAPFAPHLTESIFQNIRRRDDPPSVHMCEWPGEHRFIDEELEKNMELVREIVEEVSNLRQKIKRKLRWPVKRIIVVSDEETLRSLEEFSSILLAQTNSKKVEFLSDEEFEKEVEHRLSPKFEVIGPRFRGDARRVAEIISEMRYEDVKGRDVIEVDGYEITKEMFSIERVIPKNLIGGEFSRGRIYLDAEMDEELEAEGFAREVVRRIQEMRKRLQLEVDEMIRTSVKVDDERVERLLKREEEFIKNETRSEVLRFGEVEEEFSEEWDVEGRKIKIGISRAG